MDPGNADSATPECIFEYPASVVHARAEERRKLKDEVAALTADRDRYREAARIVAEHLLILGRDLLNVPLPMATDIYLSTINQISAARIRLEAALRPAQAPSEATIQDSLIVAPAIWHHVCPDFPGRIVEIKLDACPQCGQERPSEGREVADA